MKDFAEQALEYIREIEAKVREVERIIRDYRKFTKKDNKYTADTSTYIPWSVFGTSWDPGKKDSSTSWTIPPSFGSIVKSNTMFYRGAVS